MNQLKLQEKIDKLEIENAELKKINDIYLKSDSVLEIKKLKEEIQDLKVELHLEKEAGIKAQSKITDMRDALNEIERLAGANS